MGLSSLGVIRYMRCPLLTTGHIAIPIATIVVIHAVIGTHSVRRECVGSTTRHLTDNRSDATHSHDEKCKPIQEIHLFLNEQMEMGPVWCVN